MRHTVFKKFTSFVLALLMLLPTVPTVFAASASDFIDFPMGWSNEAVTAAVNNGLLNGRSANTIEPEGNLTRAEMATIINRAFGATVEKDISAYADVSPNEWYYHEIAKAVNMQTFQGDASGTMRPNDSITREEVFAVIARALVLETSDYSPLNRFNDAYAVSEWAKPYAAILVAKGYVNGDNLGNLNPLSNITREEFAQIMHNIVKTYHITAGEHTYAGPASTLIRVGGVTLSNVTVEGDLILGDGVGKGNVTLVNVTIKGRLLARGGEGKVTLTNTTVAGGVVVKDVNGIVNFNNYRTEAPFIGIREITKATFIGETASQGGATGGSTGGSSGGGGGGGGNPPAPADKKFTYVVNYYLENIDGTYSKHSSSINTTVSQNTTVNPYKDFTNYTFKSEGSSSKVTSVKVTENLTYNYYYNLNRYNVNIDIPSDGGSQHRTIEYKHGETLGSKFNFALYPGVKFYYVPSGGGEVVVSGSTTVSSNMTILSKTPHTVTFNHNDGLGGVTEKTVYNGEAIGTNLPTVTRTGYTFDKWTVNSDGTGAVIDGTTVITEPITVYAQWNVETYTISYVSRFNFSTTVQESYNIETGAALPGESAFVSHTGYIFDGWYTEKDPYVNKVSSIPVGSYGDVTLYARWLEENKTYYDFTFDYKYDSKTETVKVEQSHTANKPTDPVRTGYTFGGWFTDFACTSPYNFLTPVTANKTIYAKWTADEYNIVYELNGGSFKQGVSYPTKYTVDVLPLDLPLEGDVEYTGKRFVGWYKDAELTQPVFQIPENTTGEFKVYAKWTPKSYGIVYELNGATMANAEAFVDQYNTETPVTLPDASGFNSYPGYTFGGWYNNSGFTGTPITEVGRGETGNKVFYAKWDKVSYGITYELNGGVKLNAGAFKENYSITDTVYLPVATDFEPKTGYTFGGWYEEADFSGSPVTSITAGSTGAKSFWVKWDAKSYKVIYDGNTNTSGTMEFTSHKYDEITNLRKNAFAKTGHSFLGWSKTQGAAFADYNDEAPVTSLIAELEAQGKSEITLYAVWGAQTYTLTFNVNGGKNLTASDLPAGYTMVGTNAQVSVEYTGTYPQLPTPEWVDNTKRFVGWAINGAQINEGETVDITSNSEVVAIWTDKAFHTVTIYDFYEGNTKTINVIDGEKIGSLTGMKKTGYYFDKFCKHNSTDVFDIVNTEITAPVEIDAKWTANSYTIKYNGNGNTSGTMSDSTHTYGEVSSLTKNSFVKTGHKFLGWTKTQGSQIAIYTDEADVTAILSELALGNLSEITLYAVWSANSYSVKYDKNDVDAVGTMLNSNHTYGVSSSLTPNAFTKTGYSFIGWNTMPDGSGTSYANAAQVTDLSAENGAEVTLYAQWKANTYYIEYVANNGSGSMTNSTLTYGVSVNLSKNLFTRTGYTFAGWSMDQNSQIVQFTDEAPASNLTAEPGKTVKLYAVWSPISYKIIYKGKADSDSFAVTGSTTDSTFTYDAQSQFSENAFVRSGYKFMGWVYKNVTYTPNTVYSALNFSSVQDEEITVYAKWERISYTVKYHPGVNTSEVVITGTTQDSVHYFDEEQDLTTNEFVRTGYTFKGWTTTPPAGMVSVMSAFSLEAQAGDEVIYSDGQSVANLAENDGDVVTFYAIWEANKYRITYDRNGMSLLGGFPEGYTNAVYDEQVNIAPNNTFSFYGYVFQKWNTKPDGTGDSYEAGKPAINLTAQPDETVTLYAIAKEKVYSYVLHYKDDENHIDEPVTVNYNDKFVFPDNKGYTKTGYTFLGWNEISINKEPEFIPGDAEQYHFANDGAVLAYYGIWKPNNYKVSFNVDGGKALTYAEIPSDASYSYEDEKWVMTVTYDSEYPVLPRPEWTDASKYFAYWINEADNSKIVAGQTVKITDTTVLKAVWTDEIKHTVVFTDYNTDGTSYITDVINGFAIQRPNDPPQREGYTFVDWYTDRYHSQFFDFISVTAESEPTTFTAYPKWRAHKFAIIYNGNGATDGGMNNSVYSYGSEAHLKDNAFIRPGYIFDGWTTNPDGTGTYYENKADVTNLSSIDGSEFTLYAKWKASPYTVIFNGNGATGVMDSLTFNYSDNVSLPENSYTYKGYTFLGWSESKNATAPSYSDKAAKEDFINALLASDEGSITLYAVWGENSYTVAYDANGGIGSMESVTLKYNDSYTLAENTFARKGYEFLGWNTKPDRTGIAYKDRESGIKGITAQNGATVTLYAQWKIIEYSISYYGAEFIDVSKVTYNYTVEDEIALPDGNNVSGENFLYWVDENNMPVKNIIKGSIGNKKFTAVFGSQIPILHTVTFMADGEKFNELMIFDGSVLNSNTNYAQPSKQGFNFIGWNTRTDGSGTYYDPAETTVTGDVTLYAIFEEIPLENYSITYNNVEASDMANPLAFVSSYTEEDEITLPVASDFNERADGKVFAGWYDNAAFDGDPITTISKGSTGNIEYWAKWAQNYVVRFYRGAVVVNENHRKYIGDAKVPAGTSMLQSDIDNMISAVTKESTVEYYDGSYSHTVEGELWYVDSDEWKLFNSDVVVDRDIDVFYANKFVSLCLNVELGGFSLDIPGYISVPYSSDTKIIESAKDLMTAARGKLAMALATDDIYARAIEKASEKASEKDVNLIDADGNIKFVEIDTPISDIIKVSEISEEIREYITGLVVNNNDDDKLASIVFMAKDSQLIENILDGRSYDFDIIKSYILSLDDTEKEEFATELHKAVSTTKTYTDFINVFKQDNDIITVTSDNASLVVAVASAVKDYSYDELKDRIYAKFGKVIEVLGDEIVEEFMSDAQTRYYNGAELVWNNISVNEDYETTYPTFLTFRINAIDHLFKPLYDKYRVKVTDKLTEKNFYHYADNTYLRELVEMDADTIIDDLFYKVPQTDENIGYALWPSENGESGFMHYYDYLFQKLLIADNARLWYVNNLSETELEQLRTSVYDNAAKLLNKANEMLAAYEKDGSLPMGKNISDLMEIEAFAKIFNKVEDMLIKALEKFKATQFYGKEWDSNSVRYDVPYSDLAGNVIIGTDDPTFNVDSLLDDKYVGKALNKAGFKEFEDSFDSDMGSTVTVQAIERLFRNNRIEIRRYYE